MINPELKSGDRVILLHMDGETVSPGLKGVCISVGIDPFVVGGKIYEMRWDNGSKLSLVSETDAWQKEEVEK